MRALSLVSGLLLAVACGKPEDPLPQYHRDIQPLLEKSCLSCHKTDGIAPLVFDTPEKAKQLAPAIWAAVESGRMPPFYASSECNTYKDDPRLTVEERITLKTWVELGAPLGDVALARHAEVPAPPTVRHDRVMSIGGAFDVRAMGDGTLDNYRCFAMDPMATEAVMVAGHEVIPGNVKLVHHVLAYEVVASKLGELQRLDDAAPGLGYPCKSGSVGIDGTFTRQIAGWVPGATPTRMPAGSGLYLSAGSKIVIQIHYNLNVGAEVSPLDETKLALEVAPAGSLETAYILPMLDDDFDIAPNDPSATHSKTQPYGLFLSGARIYAVMGHMHQLGSRVKLERLRKGAPDVCMLDIPNWDFNWQRDYRLSKPIGLGSEDELRITCTFDNSADNQPYVNGVQQTPRRVRWGESSFDEMCMVYMTFTRPQP